MATRRTKVKDADDLLKGSTASPPTSEAHDATDPPIYKYSEHTSDHIDTDLIMDITEVLDRYTTLPKVITTPTNTYIDISHDLQTLFNNNNSKSNDDNINNNKKKSNVTTTTGHYDSS